jgi:hypothetical protein
MAVLDVLGAQLFASDVPNVGGIDDRRATSGICGEARQ